MVAVFTQVGQSFANIPDIFRTKAGYESDVEQDAGTNLAQPVAERLFDAVVFLFARRLRIVSYLGDEMHAPKVGIRKTTFVYCNLDLNNPHGNQI